MATPLAVEDSRQQFLSFSLPRDTTALLPTAQLTEVLSLKPEEIVLVPDMPKAVMGVCNWRGEVLWLLDFGYWLGFQVPLTQQYPQTHYSVLVIHRQPHVLGLVVRQVGNMHWCPLHQIQSSPIANLAPELAACLQGYWSTAEETCLVFNGDALVEHLVQQLSQQNSLP